MIEILTATSIAFLIGVILRERRITELEKALATEREKLAVAEFENHKNIYRSDGVIFELSPENQQQLWDAVMSVDDCDCILEVSHFIENEAVE